MVRVLVDTNILLDYITCRAPYSNWAEIIIEACINCKISACVAAHSIPNMFYILRKDFTIEERRKILQDLCKIFDVSAIDKKKLTDALNDEGFDDFEDCLQEKCAVDFHADYIVTRNIKDFVNGTIPCIEPDVFCNLLI